LTVSGRRWPAFLTALVLRRSAVSNAGRDLPAGLAAGVLAAQLLFFYGIPVLAPAALLLCVAAVRRSALPAALAIGLAWAEQALETRRVDRLDPALTGIEVELTGAIVGLPEVFDSYTRFRFRPLRDAAQPVLPGTLIAHWYRDPPLLAPGETWRLKVTLKPPWAEVNFQGVDRERWYFAEGVGGLATVRSGHALAAQPVGPVWHRWRHAVRERLTAAVPDAPRRGILLALALADRSALERADRLALAGTGTAHLLAISGLHVGLAALYGFWLARGLALAVPLAWGGGRLYPLCLAAGGLAATAYAALAGFGTSTVRALVMLAVALLALLSRRALHPGRAWLLALAAVLLIDPLAPWRAGFWLSFAAVAVLLCLFAPRRGGGRGFWRRLLLAQAGIMLVMFPLSAYWFQAASPAGLIANLVAIPWVSLLVVPLTLLGVVLLPAGDALAGPVLDLAGAAAQLLTRLLELIASLPAAQVYLPQPALAAVVLATAGAMLLLLPRGVPQRRLGLVLLLPLLVNAERAPAGGIRLELLDLGQGSALLLAVEDHLLLYDSGPGDGADYDRVEPVIVPAIHQAGHAAPERILISHADLDHAGGLSSLQARYPGSTVHASLPQARAGVASCDDGLAWHWGAAELRVLHPSPYLPYLGNDASCVLSVRRGNLSVLLTGDISQAVEQRLVADGLAPYTVLLAPHHGSASSSSAELLSATAPQVAVASAGVGNRFGFPRPEVRERYRRAGIPFWSTDACGALRLELAADGSIKAASARRVRAAPWRWPVAPDCP
jgi:competence protein ComEC